MCAVQLAPARIGRVTGRGLAANMALVLPRPLVLGLIALLFVANTINIGADLAAMGGATAALIGWRPHLLTILFALISLGLQLALPYRRYARLLKWATLVLFAYFAVLFFVPLDGRAILAGLLPTVPDRSAVTTVVAVFGTTISPYLFFWQSAQEVEELTANAAAAPLRDAPWQAGAALGRIRFDTLVGMGLSNLVAGAIVIAAAATLHAHGITEVTSAEQAARALAPAAGRYAFLLFTLGIIGTGLLAIPVLAGSAAYAIGDVGGWRSGLDLKPWEAVGFYAVIGLATLLGMGIIFSPLDPISALYWSAVINGVAAVPIMAGMMLVARHVPEMGVFTLSPRVTLLGWLATAVMAGAAAAMLLV